MKHPGSLVVVQALTAFLMMLYLLDFMGSEHWIGLILVISLLMFLPDLTFVVDWPLKYQESVDRAAHYSY